MTDDDYERRIREKVFASKILSKGEWVYLIGLFHTAREAEAPITTAAQTMPIRDEVACLATCDGLEHWRTTEYGMVESRIVNSPNSYIRSTDIRRRFDAMRVLLAAQPPAAPVEKAYDVAFHENQIDQMEEARARCSAVTGGQEG